VERSRSSTRPGPRPSRLEEAREPKGLSRSHISGRSSSADAPADTGAAPRIRPSSRRAGARSNHRTWARKSPVAAPPGGETHVLEVHGRRDGLGTRRGRYSDSRRRGSRGRSPGCPVSRDRGRLATFRPTRVSCSRQSFFSKTSSAGWKPLWISSSAQPDDVVGKTVDVLRLEAVHEHPVKAGEMVGAPNEGVWMGLGPISVTGRESAPVEAPGPRPGCSKWSSSLILDESY